MDTLWTLPELVSEVATRIAALPAPKNGQVRAIPDERTVRYYVTLGLLDRPSAMRGRTALYGMKHVAQVVAIKRLQTMGRSLSEIQALWPTLDDPTLARMSGVEFSPGPRSPGRAEFWKREPREKEAAMAGDATAGGGELDAREAMSPGSTQALGGLTRAPGGPRVTWSAPVGGPGATSGASIAASSDPSAVRGAPIVPPGPTVVPPGPVVVPPGPTVVPSGPMVVPPGPTVVSPGPTVVPPGPGGMTPGMPVIGVVVPAGAAGTSPVAGVSSAVELRIELAPQVVLSLSVVDESVAVSPADVRAIRAAAAPLLAELAARRLAPHPGGESS